MSDEAKSPILYQQWRSDTEAGITYWMSAYELRVEVARHACATASDVICPLTEEVLLKHAMHLLDQIEDTLRIQKRSYEREIEIEVAAERERCANLCDAVAADTRDDHFDAITAEECASRIRGIRSEA